MKPRKRIVETVAMAALVLLARAASATPLAYDEAISGDLGDTFPATQFTLDAGSNTISGTTHFFSTLVSDDTDFDDFAFVVPVGTHLTGITFGFETVGIPGNTVARSEYRLDNGNAFPSLPFLGDETIDFLGASPMHPFTGGLPLDAGTFTLAQVGLETTITGGWEARYTWTLDVVSDTAVPEPASLCLLGTGIAGVWIRRRRQSRG